MSKPDRRAVEMKIEIEDKRYVTYLRVKKIALLCVVR